MDQFQDEAIADDIEYDPVPFKRTKPRLFKSELTTISIEELAKDTRFRSRAANSLLFYHFGDKVCECIIGEFKRSEDIEELI